MRGEEPMERVGEGRAPEPEPGVGALVHLSGVLAAVARGGAGAADGAVGNGLLDRALDRAAREAERGAVEETLLQSYLFLGYPAALNALARWRERHPGPVPRPGVDDWDSWVGRGEEVCEVVYGGQYRRLRENVRALHPDLERWMVAEGYGKVLGRPGLPLLVRELCVVGLLAVLDVPRQLHSHLRGARNGGASAAQVEAALEEVEELMDEGGRARARELAARVLKSRKEEETG